MNKTVVAPSVLSLDYSRMEQQLKELEESQAEWLHFDVMDGHFVPNLSFGPDLMKGFVKGCSLKKDVHLMVEEPEKFIDSFIKAGADVITFHTEALDNDPEAIAALLKYIRGKGMQAGIVVKPKTDIQQFKDLLKDLDVVLIMSVEPGFGGQSCMESVLDKARFLDEVRKEEGLNFRIEIEGGINSETAKLAKAAGVDTLVSGSWLFKNGIKESVEALL